MGPTTVLLARVSSHQRVMVIVIRDEHGCCGLNFLITLGMATSVVVANLRSAISKRGGQLIAARLFS